MTGKILFFVVAVVLLTYTEVRGDDKCDNLGVLLYEEIGCKPVKAKLDDRCPSSYDCSHLQEKGDFCYFQGKKYKNTESLPDNAISGTCNGGCHCEVFDGSPSKFTCAVFDCAEFLGGNPLTNRQCIRTYELESCCSAGEICPPFGNISTCKVDGEVHKEGQRFYPKNSCQSCVCGKGFAGKYEAPFCKRQNCVQELRNSKDIKENCAPVYENNGALCCPILWACPSKTDVFSPTNKNNASPKTCKYGDKEIKSGQILRKTIERYSQIYNFKCDCRVPPLLTCVIE